MARWVVRQWPFEERDDCWDSLSAASLKLVRTPPITAKRGTVGSGVETLENFVGGLGGADVAHSGFQGCGQFAAAREGIVEDRLQFSDQLDGFLGGRL